MDKPKGGRGKRAEYASEMIRIPEPIKDRVLKIKEMFYENQLDSYDEKLVENERLAREHENLLTDSTESSTSENNLPSLDDAIAQAKRIIGQKKSARESIAKLLTSLYGTEVSKDIL